MDEQQTAGDAILLMNTDRIQRSISRMAYQVAEDNRKDAEVLIIGIKDRGGAVAKALNAQLSDLAEKEVTRLRLSKNERGDFAFNEGADAVEKSYNYIILVDAVIFSGRTMLAAVQKTLARFSPSVLRTAVLVDRGHRKMPVGATFAGISLPTKLNEHVQVNVKEQKPYEVILSKTSE